MTAHAAIDGRSQHVSARRHFLGQAALASAGIALSSTSPLVARAAPASPLLGRCPEHVHNLLNTALAVERLMTTFYYTGLTSSAVLHDPKVAGSSGNLHAVGPDGTPGNAANLQAALDQEQMHAQAMAMLGGTSPHTHFYFPGSVFASLGHTRTAGTFLWMLDHLKTACIGFYLETALRFGALNRLDLADFAARLYGVECEHRALYRVIAGDDPADNVTLEVASFACMADAKRFLRPFLTGHGLQGAVLGPIPLPAPTVVAGVVGTHSSD